MALCPPPSPRVLRPSSEALSMSVNRQIMPALANEFALPA